MNENETEYFIEYDAITGEVNVERGSQKKFPMAPSHGSMEFMREIDMENTMIFEGAKITITPNDYVPSSVNTIKGEPAFKYMDNPVQWY